MKRAFTFILLFVMAFAGALALVPQSAFAQAAGSCSNVNDTYDAATNKCVQQATVDENGGYFCSPPYEKGPQVYTCVTNATTAATGAKITCEAPFTANAQDNICEAPATNGQCPAGSTPYREEGAAGGGLKCRKAGTPVAGAGEATAEQDSCPIAKNQELRWLYCPVFKGMAVLTNTLDAFINEYLTTGNKIFDTDKSANTGKVEENGYKAAWQTFRNFGISLVVIAGLIMLVSEAFGLDFVDAYTVRKVLPRLMVAILGISLSWELCKFVIEFFDTVGRAAGSIIYSSFGVGDQGIEIWALIVANLMAATGVLAAAVLLTGLGLFSLVGTLILAMLVGAAVLILRQAIIIACVIMAPLAIAAYILPNTSKLAHFWWDTFSRMLMLYPIATGLIALCKVMGKIAMTNPGGTGGNTAISSLIATVSGIIFFFAGYALLPVAFRLTGGLVATIGGLANDRSRGGFDRLKNFRKGRTERSIAQMKAGERFQGTKYLPGSSWAAGKANAATYRAGVKRFGLGAQGRSALSEKGSLMAAAHAKSAQGEAGKFNDDLLQAQTYSTEAEARQNMMRDFGIEDNEKGRQKVENAIAMAKANGGFGKARQVAAAKALAATGTGYADLGQMSQTIARVSGGNEGAIQDMVGAMRGAAKQSGRIDLGGAGHGTVAGLARESAKEGYARPKDGALDAALVEAARSTDNVTIARGKPTSTAQMSAAIGRELERNVDIINNSKDSSAVSAASVHAAQLTAKVKNMEGSTSYGHEVGTDAMYNGVKKDGSLDKGFASPKVVANVETVQTLAKPRLPVLDAHGQIQKDSEGKVITEENPRFDPESPLQDRLRQQMVQRGYNPNDPNLN